MRVFASMAAALLVVGAAIWLTAEGLIALGGGIVALLALLGLATAGLYVVLEPDATARGPRRSLSKVRRRPGVASLAARRCSQCARLLVERRGIEVCAVCDHVPETGSG